MSETIGDRIKRLRPTGMTQSILAAKAGLSLSLIRQLEQNQRQTASIGSLHSIARALDVDLGELFGSPAMPDAGPESGVIALRNAVANVDDLIGDDPSEGSTLDRANATRTERYLWGTYWSGKYDLLTSLTPHALYDLRATLHNAGAADRPWAADALARAYWAAACTLAHLRQPDSAFVAIREAIRVCDKSSDPFLAATLRGTVSWQMLVNGRFDEAEKVALRAAESIEPHGDVESPQLSAYGSLILTGATAAARGQRKPQARELVEVASETAARIGADRDDYETAFGPSQVAMQRVDVGIVTEEYGSALADARLMPKNPNLPLAARARHNTDKAFAHVQLGHDEQAQKIILATESMAPDWMRHQTLAKSVARELLVREARTSTPLRLLATRIGVSRP